MNDADLQPIDADLQPIDAAPSVDGAGEEARPERACVALPSGDREGTGPAPLLAAPAFEQRPDGLGVVRESVEVGTLALGGRSALEISFDVVMFDHRFGRAWRRPVTIGAPLGGELRHVDAVAYSASRGTLNAVGPGGEDPVHGQDHPSWFAGTDTPTHHMMSFGSVVLTSGLPYVAADPLPEAIELDADVKAAIRERAVANDDPCDDERCLAELTDDEDKMDCLIHAAMATGDMSYDPFLNFAVSQGRILDAAEAVLNGVYEARGSAARVNWERVWTIGSSKRGHLQRAFAAIDPRAKGVLIAAADLSNLPAFLEQQLAVWSGGFSFSAPHQRPLLDTPEGRNYLSCCDPFTWPPSVFDGVTMLVAVGTRDHYYPLGASLTYAAALPDSARMLMIPNYGHGHGTVDHVAAFRGMIEAGLAGAELPRLEASWDVEGGLISARLTGAQATSAELWCATSLGPPNPAARSLNEACVKEPMSPIDGPDLRHMTWTRHTMNERGVGQWEAPPPPSALSHPACLVRLETDGGLPLTSGPLLSRALCEASGLSLE